MLKYSVVLFVIGSVCGGPVSTPCSLKDSVCLAKSATETLKFLLPGNKELKTPNLTPIVLPLVSLEGNQFNAQLINLAVHGIEDSVISSVKFDTEAKKAEAVLDIPRAELISDYTLKGKISIIALDGAGKSNVTAVGGIITWTFNYDIIEKEGKKYLQIKDDDTTYTVKRAYFQFDDLIKGDEATTKTANEALNAEWEAVLADVGKAISSAIGSVFKLITQQVFTKYPLNEITKE